MKLPCALGHLRRNGLMALVADDLAKLRASANRRGCSTSHTIAQEKALLGRALVSERLLHTLVGNLVLLDRLDQRLQRFNL